MPSNGQAQAKTDLKSLIITCVIAGTVCSMEMFVPYQMADCFGLFQEIVYIHQIQSTSIRRLVIVKVDVYTREPAVSY